MVEPTWKTVAASTGGPPSQATPNPSLQTSRSPLTMPMATPGTWKSAIPLAT